MKKVSIMLEIFCTRTIRDMEIINVMHFYCSLSGHIWIAVLAILKCLKKMYEIIISMN